MLTSPQIQLQNGTLGETVDETEGLIKRHKAFEKLVNSQEEKVALPFCLSFILLSQ